jgi:hypothetical protein
MTFCGAINLYAADYLHQPFVLWIANNVSLLRKTVNNE